jgi:archaemetzincin
VSSKWFRDDRQVVRYACLVRALLASSILVILLACPLVSGAGSEAQAEQVQPRANFCFAPLGRHDKQLLESARRGAEYLYGVQTTILPKRRLPKFAYYRPRKRYRAEKLLDFLQDEVVPESGCDIVIGFTAVDISTTKDSHKDWGILGLGEVGGTVGVVSSFRMRRRANRTKQKHRVVGVTNHEIGHVLGAPHGGAPGCLMNDAQGTIRTVDEEHGLLCSESRALIEAHTGRPLPVIETFDWSEVLGP